MAEQHYQSKIHPNQLLQHLTVASILALWKLEILQDIDNLHNNRTTWDIDYDFAFSFTIIFLALFYLSAKLIGLVFKTWKLIWIHLFGHAVKFEYAIVY